MLTKYFQQIFEFFYELTLSNAGPGLGWMCVGRLGQIIHHCSMFNVTLMCVLFETGFFSISAGCKTMYQYQIYKSMQCLAGKHQNH